MSETDVPYRADDSDLCGQLSGGQGEHRVSGSFLYLGVILFYYSTTLIHPSGALIRPIWMPVRVSYSFWVISPIFSIPLGMQISLP